VLEGLNHPFWEVSAVFLRWNPFCIYQRQRHENLQRRACCCAYA